MKLGVKTILILSLISLILAGGVDFTKSSPPGQSINYRNLFYYGSQETSNPYKLYYNLSYTGKY